MAEAVDEWVKTELDQTAELARRVAQEFYDELEAANDRAQQEGGTLNKVTVRVRQHSGSLYIQWVQFRFYRDSSGKLRRASETIRKGRGTQRYSLTVLMRRAPDPEVQKAIEEAENRFVPLREYARALVEARKTFRQTRQAGEAVADIKSALDGGRQESVFDEGGDHA